jgi:excinuclease UvrABC nuclease subunit
MKKIEKSNFIDNKKQLPEKAGIFYFSQKNRILYVGYSSNLQRAVSTYFTENPEDKNIIQLISLTDEINYQIKEDLFSAFISAKMLINKKNPEFNHYIQNYKDFVYLGIDFYNPPFFKIMENTQDDLYYLGAFESRFMLLDFIESLNKTAKLPNCSSEEFPCELLKLEECDGYCLKDNPEKMKMIFDFYLFPKGDFEKELEEIREKLMDNLEFLKAELIKKQLKIIRNFYQRVKFLVVTKNLNCVVEDEKYKFHIESGLIKIISNSNFQTEFQIAKVDFRANEISAIEKKNLAEAWFVYKKVNKLNPGLIKQIYKENKEKLIKTLS